MNKKKVVSLFERKVINFQGKVFEVKSNILRALILAEKCDSANLYRLDLDNFELKKIQ